MNGRLRVQAESFCAVTSRLVSRKGGGCHWFHDCSLQSSWMGRHLAVKTVLPAVLTVIPAVLAVRLSFSLLLNAIVFDKGIRDAIRLMGFVVLG